MSTCRDCGNGLGVWEISGWCDLCLNKQVTTGRNYWKRPVIVAQAAAYIELHKAAKP